MENVKKAIKLLAASQFDRDIPELDGSAPLCIQAGFAENPQATSAQPGPKRMAIAG